MKKIALLILSFALACTMSKNVSAQSTTMIDSTVLWLEINDPTLLPTSDRTEFTSHSAYNQFLTSNGITYYDSKYKGTSHPELKMYVEMRFHKSDPYVMKQAFLNSQYSAMIEAISIEEYLVDEVMVYDPTDYHWYWAPDGEDFLWHLKNIQADQAWDITLGDPNIKIAIFDTNYDIQHEDFTDQLVYDFDPFSGLPLNCTGNQHGTMVAGMASAETAETGTVAAGQYASVGFNTKLLLYTSTFSPNTFLQKVFHAVNDEGARVIVTAANGGITPCDPANCPPETATIIDEIFNQGAVVVMPAGNGLDGYDCSQNNEYVPVGCLNPVFDSRIIVVTSSSIDDTHQFFVDGVDRTHSHFSEVDLCAPGYEVAVMKGCPDEGEWPYWGGARGTSFSSPLVAGCASLILSIDPCLEAGDVENILKSTTDPIVDAANYPGQVGSGRVNIFQACSLAQGYGTVSLAQSGTTVISSDVYSSSDIEILDGMTVELLGTLRMASGKKIIVKTGGTLILDGGTITNSKGCNDFWQGIEVAGDTDQHQYSFGGGNYHQGRLILKNGAVIENARNGARNMLGYDWGARGGIIQATNSSFINCRRAVEFMSYQNFSPSNQSINRPDQSYFRECLFELNDDYLINQDIEPPAARITLWETDRVRISGCQFINTSTVAETANRSVGVYSHDANYSITERCLDNPQQVGVCNNEVPSLFKGWHKAVEALETSSGRPIVVRKSIFEENMIGVEINGTSFSEIYQNEFLVGDHPFPEFADEAEDTKNHLGIHVIETTHYAVEENDVVKTSGATYEGNGVLVYNSKGAENAVYKNQFTNLQTGAESDWINRNVNYTGGVPAGLAGLQFLCNTNSGNKVDFRISRNELFDQTDYFYIHAGTRQDHGSNQPARPAKNAFSSPDSDPFNYVHFTVNTEFAYKYFYDNNPPSMNEITPGTFVAPILVSNAQGCPSNFTTGFVDLPIKHELSESQGGFNGLLFTYQETIDQGNTPAMITEIDLAYPSEAWEMRNTLLARSPYNSEQVLIAAALREIMPHSMLLEVLLANPDALRSGNVIRVVSTQLTNPMPQYMIDMLYAARDETTLRTIMETTLADLNFERQRIYKRLVNSKFFLDDQVDEPDSVIYYLSQINTLESNIARAAAYSDRNQFSAATTLLDSMIVHFKLDQAQVDELQALKTLYGLIETAESQGRNIAQLDSSEIASLTALADNDDAGLAQNKAENALCFHYDICPVPVGTPKNVATLKPKPTKEELVEKLNTSAAYPNPATDFVTIEFEVLFARENTRLSVFDPLGREVESRILGSKYQGQELFDTRNWRNGLYIYSITQHDELIETGKFTIIR
jgi:subtilisin family serine protease